MKVTLMTFVNCHHVLFFAYPRENHRTQIRIIYNLLFYNTYQFSYSAVCIIERIGLYIGCCFRLPALYSFMYHEQYLITLCALKNRLLPSCSIA
jgi:hypothetical protein